MNVVWKEYNEVAFLCNGTDRHEIPAENVNWCALSNLDRKISDIPPKYAQLRHTGMHLFHVVGRFCANELKARTFLFPN